MDEETARRKSSMQYWLPKLEASNAPVPKTEYIHVQDWEDATKVVEGVPVPDDDELVSAVKSVGGPPAFLRSDQASHKHSMDTASRVDSLDAEHLHSHAFKVLEFNKVAGFEPLPFTHLAVRQWLDLKSSFTAFRGTPISSEIRFFLNNGTVHDYGFYWPEDSIERSRQEPSVDDWRSKLDDLKSHALSQADRHVKPLAKSVAEELDDGYWSVDFAETEDGEWYAIDAAVGLASWHPDGCEKPPSLQ